MPVDIPKLSSLAAAMVRKALQAFIEGDAEMARSVLTLEKDDGVDEKMDDLRVFLLSDRFASLRKQIGTALG